MVRMRERSTEQTGEEAQAAVPRRRTASLGNRAVQQLVTAEHAPALVPDLPVGNRAIARLVQAKLAVGAAGDPFEREADRIAASVVAPDVAASVGGAPDVAASVVAARDGAAAAGRGPGPVAVTAARAPAGAGPVAPIAVERSLDGAGSALDDGVRRRFEDRMGHSFADVRIHPDSAAPASIGATAFTVGTDIVFGPGRFAPEDPAGERLLAHELAHTVQQRGGTAPVQRDSGPGGPPPTTGGIPVLFGFDQTARRIYASVSVPGHTVAEISTYLYGTEDKAAELRQANGVDDSVPPGRNLVLVAGTLSAAAQSTVNQALSDGSILRSQGIPIGESGTGPVVVYRFTAGGQVHELTEGQLRAMAQGQATWVARQAARLHDYAEIGRQTHQEYLDQTNSVVRWISNELAGQDLLPVSVWSDAMSQSQAILDALAAFDATGGAVDAVVGLVSAQANQLPGAAAALDNAERAWHRYVEGTIGGAEVAVHHLEIVRDASFLIAAGLAGAAVAPVVFAAAGTGLATVGVTGATATVLSGTAAVAGGAVAGGATNTGLNLVAPSSTDTRSTAEQMKSSFARGAVAGGLGAAGALAAPGVSGAVSQGIYGTAPEALAGAGSRAVVGGVTGAALGGPLGAAGTAIDNVQALASGQITTEEYLRRIGWGALTGAVSGAVLGALGGALSRPQPGSGLSTTTPGAGAGDAPALEPDVIYQPPQVDPRTGVVSQTLLHRPTGQVLRATYDPATGTGDIVNVATGQRVAVVNNGVVTPVPGAPPGLPQPAAELPPGPAGPSITVSSGAMPATGPPVIDPFSGEALGTRTASAQTPRSLVTGIRADEGEAAAWRQALLRGEVGLQAPMGANLAGPDFMTAQFGGNGQATLIVTDVKTSMVGSFPAPATAMPATWTAELQAAIQPGRLNIGDPVKENAIRQAFAQGRVRLRQLNADYSPTGGGAITGF